MLRGVGRKIEENRGGVAVMNFASICYTLRPLENDF